jgi:hypothetical protein
VRISEASRHFDFILRRPKRHHFKKSFLETRKCFASIQGCQIFLDTVFQNGGKDTKLPLNFKWTKNVPNGHDLFQMAKEPFPFQGPPNFTQIAFFWFENKPSGNPASIALGCVLR